MQRIERIIKYLDGKLDPPELEKFKAELIEDPSLLDELTIHKEVDEVILQIDEERFRNKLKDVYALFVQEELQKSQSQKKRHNNIRKVLVSASIFTVLFIFTYFFLIRRENNLDLYKHYFKSFSQDVYIRSDNEHGANKHLEAGFTFYYQGKFKEAFEQLEFYHSIDSAHIAAAFYCGMSALEIGKITEAGDYFKWVIKEKPNYYFEHAEWYLALSYVRLGEKSLALSLLNALKNGNSTYSDHSKKIICQLNRKRYKNSN
jgi:tetratricopeptide (TPR) repeat protein